MQYKYTAGIVGSDAAGSMPMHPDQPEQRRAHLGGPASTSASDVRAYQEQERQVNRVNS